MCSDWTGLVTWCTIYSSPCAGGGPRCFKYGEEALDSGSLQTHVQYGSIEDLNSQFTEFFWNFGFYDKGFGSFWPLTLGRRYQNSLPFRSVLSFAGWQVNVRAKSKDFLSRCSFWATVWLTRTIATNPLYENPCLAIKLLKLNSKRNKQTDNLKTWCFLLRLSLLRRHKEVTW